MIDICHSERSEESGLARSQIPRCARNDKLLAAVCCVLISGCQSFVRWDEPPDRQQSASRFEGQAPAPRGNDRRLPIEPAPDGQQRRLPVEPALPPCIADAGTYCVQRGDTLYSIAFRNSVDYRELARWNGIGRDYYIRPNQKLRLSTPAQAAAIPQAQAPVKPALVSKPVGVRLPASSYPRGYEWEWPTRGALQRSYSPSEDAKGWDIRGEHGQPVFAAAPGRVVYSGNALKGYGELIIIKHDEMLLSAYGYNRKRYVAEGDVVTSGQPIGELGLGPKNQPLLHFEIRKQGKPVNPAEYLPKAP